MSWMLLTIGLLAGIVVGLTFLLAAQRKNNERRLADAREIADLWMRLYDHATEGRNRH